MFPNEKLKDWTCFANDRQVKSTSVEGTRNSFEKFTKRIPSVTLRRLETHFSKLKHWLTQYASTKKLCRSGRYTFHTDKTRDSTWHSQQVSVHTVHILRWQNVNLSFQWGSPPFKFSFRFGSVILYRDFWAVHVFLEQDLVQKVLFTPKMSSPLHCLCLFFFFFAFLYYLMSFVVANLSVRTWRHDNATNYSGFDLGTTQQNCETVSIQTEKHNAGVVYLNPTFVVNGVAFIFGRNILFQLSSLTWSCNFSWQKVSVLLWIFLCSQTTKAFLSSRLRSDLQTPWMCQEYFTLITPNIPQRGQVHKNQSKMCKTRSHPNGTKAITSTSGFRPIHTSWCVVLHVSKNLTLFFVRVYANNILRTQNATKTREQEKETWKLSSLRRRWRVWWSAGPQVCAIWNHHVAKLSRWLRQPHALRLVAARCAWSNSYTPNSASGRAKIRFWTMRRLHWGTIPTFPHACFILQKTNKTTFVTNFLSLAAWQRWAILINPFSPFVFFLLLQTTACLTISTLQVRAGSADSNLLFRGCSSSDVRDPEAMREESTEPALKTSQDFSHPLSTFNNNSAEENSTDTDMSTVTPTQASRKLSPQNVSQKHGFSLSSSMIHSWSSSGGSNSEYSSKASHTAKIRTKGASSSRWNRSSWQADPLVASQITVVPEQGSVTAFVEPDQIISDIRSATTTTGLVHRTFLPPDLPPATTAHVDNPEHTVESGTESVTSQQRRSMQESERASSENPPDSHRSELLVPGVPVSESSLHNEGFSGTVSTNYSLTDSTTAMANTSESAIVVDSPNRWMWILFTSDERISTSGFRATWTFTDSKCFNDHVQHSSRWDGRENMTSAKQVWPWNSSIAACCCAVRVGGVTLLRWDGVLAKTRQSRVFEGLEIRQENTPGRISNSDPRQKKKKKTKKTKKKKQIWSFAKERGTNTKGLALPWTKFGANFVHFPLFFWRVCIKWITRTGVPIPGAEALLFTFWSLCAPCQSSLKPVGTWERVIKMFPAVKGRTWPFQNTRRPDSSTCPHVFF